MELIKLLIGLLREAVWPGTVIFLVIYLDRRGGESIKKILEGIVGRRNIRAKVGGTELEFNIVEKLQQDINKIANEPDQERRLELAKQALFIDDAIREIDETDLAYLRKYHNQARVFITDYYTTGSMSDEELRSYSKLSKLRLIHGYPATGSESIDYITPAGEEVLQKLGQLGS